MTNSHIDSLVSAITSKISGLISNHNSDSSAHSSKFNSKQDSLVSGTNIKTINNQSLLGSGNINIQGSGGGGGSYISDYYIDTTNDEIVLVYTNTVSGDEVTIADNLTTNDSTQALSARQGKVLGDMIGNAINLINGSGN